MLLLTYSAALLAIVSMVLSAVSPYLCAGLRLVPFVCSSPAAVSRCPGVPVSRVCVSSVVGEHCIVPVDGTNLPLPWLFPMSQGVFLLKKIGNVNTNQIANNPSKWLSEMKKPHVSTRRQNCIHNEKPQEPG